MMKQGAMLKRILFAALLAACSMVPGVSVAQAQLAEEAQQVCAPDPYACILGEALHPEVLRCLKFPLQPGFLGFNQVATALRALRVASVYISSSLEEGPRATTDKGWIADRQLPDKKPVLWSVDSELGRLRY